MLSRLLHCCTTFTLTSHTQTLRYHMAISTTGVGSKRMSLPVKGDLAEGVPASAGLRLAVCRQDRTVAVTLHPSQSLFSYFKLGVLHTGCTDLLN